MMGNTIFLMVFLCFSALAIGVGVSVAEGGHGPFTIAFATMIAAAIPAFILLCFILDYGDGHEGARNILFATLALGVVLCLAFVPFSQRPDQFFGVGVALLLAPLPVLKGMSLTLGWERKNT